MHHTFTIALLATAILAAPASAARYCHGRHGHAVHCHRVLAPRINLKAKHPVKILRCRADREHVHGC